jgi:hypothetical protein
VCARLLTRVYRVTEALAVLEPIADERRRRELTIAQARALDFALGDLHDLDGRFAQAFACYERGNHLKPAHFDARLLQTQVESTLATFSTAGLAKLPRLIQSAPELLFIVGVPRSGTSLVEHILASHPHVIVAAEPAPLGTLAQRSRRARRIRPA